MTKWVERETDKDKYQKKYIRESVWTLIIENKEKKSE